MKPVFITFLGLISMLISNVGLCQEYFVGRVIQVRETRYEPCYPNQPQNPCRQELIVDNLYLEAHKNSKFLFLERASSAHASIKDSVRKFVLIERQDDAWIVSKVCTKKEFRVNQGKVDPDIAKLICLDNR